MIADYDNYDDDDDDDENVYDDVSSIINRIVEVIKMKELIA